MYDIKGNDTPIFKTLLWSEENFVLSRFNNINTTYGSLIGIGLYPDLESAKAHMKQFNAQKILIHRVIQTRIKTSKEIDNKIIKTYVIDRNIKYYKLFIFDEPFMPKANIYIHMRPNIYKYVSKKTKSNRYFLKDNNQYVSLDNKFFKQLEFSKHFRQKIFS